MPGYEGGLKRIEHSLRNLSEAKVRHGSKCQIGISYTIQSATVSSVPEMIRFAEECDALQVENDPVVVFKLAHGRGSFVCNVSQLHKLETEVLGNSQFLSNPRVDLWYIKEFLDRMGKDNVASGRPLSNYYKIENFACFTPYLFSLIDAFGDVYVCCHHYDDNGKLNSPERLENRLGSVAQEPFETIWNGDVYRAMRRRLRHIDTDNMPTCGQCTRHYLPNTAMTQVFNIVYAPIIEKHGEAEGRRIFEDMVSGYPPEAIWF
jgi:MoaA/NifB/PqqE/SkfB family radical SAM enzyme